MDNTDPNLVGMQLDTYWTLRGGQDPIDWINKLGKRCSMIHQKDLPHNAEPINVFDIFPPNAIFDFTAFSKLFKVKYFTEVGSGIMNIQGIIEAAIKNNVKHIIVEQDLTILSEIDSVSRSYKAISDILKNR